MPHPTLDSGDRPGTPPPAPLVLHGWQDAISALRNRPTAEARAVASSLFWRLWFTQDHREAQSVFAETKEPTFHGR